MPRKYGWAKKRDNPPEGYDYVKPTLQALENELRAAIADDGLGIRKNEATWPVHQISWQKSRYIYDMYYEHKKINKKLFDWLIEQKVVDGPLMAQWRKQGYERLCSMLVINPSNFNYGTVSICRVPRQQLREDQIVESVITGCRGCCSGKGGYANIFGNKYGQRLAAIQVRREELLAEQQRRRKERAEAEARARRAQAGSSDSSDSSSSDESDSDSDDDDEDNAKSGSGGKRKRGGNDAGIWAANAGEEALAETDGDGDRASTSRSSHSGIDGVAQHKRARSEVSSAQSVERVEPGDFHASETFSGPKPGFIFKRGSKGVGYYTDVVAAGSQE